MVLKYLLLVVGTVLVVLPVALWLQVQQDPLIAHWLLIQVILGALSICLHFVVRLSKFASHTGKPLLAGPT